MKTIAGRLHKLEERLGLQPETEFNRGLRERLKTLRRRTAERRVREGLPPEDPDEEDLSGLTLTEILHRRCARARARAEAEEERIQQAARAWNGRRER
jgi:hypothetical protein